MRINKKFFDKTFSNLTFNIKLSELQFLLMVPQEEMEVLPCDPLLFIKACGLHHGLDAVLSLAL